MSFCFALKFLKFTESTPVSSLIRHQKQQEKEILTSTETISSRIADINIIHIFWGKLLNEAKKGGKNKKVTYDTPIYKTAHILHIIYTRRNVVKYQNSNIN